MVLWIIALLLALLVFGSVAGIWRALLPLLGAAGQFVVGIALVLLATQMPAGGQQVLIALGVIGLVSMIFVGIWLHIDKERKRLQKAKDEAAGFEERNERIRRKQEAEDEALQKSWGRPASPP